MEPFEDDPVLRMAEAIADGSAEEWDDAASPEGGPPPAVVRELNVLAELARVHRRAGVEVRPTVPADPLAEALHVEPREWGPFEVLEELGRGTFGVVYRVRDLRLDRDVALKLFTPRPESAESPTIVAEGRRLAKVDHPNVITVYGADVVNGVAGIWMELLSGRTLQQELDDRGPLGAREAALIGIDLCRALAAVHRAGLVHRDVKAQNVIREDGGRTVLMDFGAGCDIDGPDGALKLAGTPLYMAPEVLAGGAALPCADLYGLGVLLYRLVTNDFPVSAPTLEALRQAHAAGSRRRLRDVRPDLPSAFIRAVQSATEAAPADRASSAAALEAQLEAVLLPEGTRSEAARTRLRVLGWWPIATMVTALIVAAIGLGWIGRTPVAIVKPSGIQSLAVLPFANLTGRADQEYVADGITQILIQNLAQLKSLPVISRTSAMVYKGSNKPLATIASELNVDGIIEGSVAQSGDRLRITVELLRSNEQFVWGQTYERPVADRFKVTGEISSMIADAVKLSLTPAERQALVLTPGVQAEAQEAFLRGLRRLDDFRAEPLKQALADLLEAVRLDPASARVYAALSQCYLMLGAVEVLSNDESYMRAQEAAEHALLLNDRVAEAYTELAEVKFYHEWNWEWAQKAYARAIELDHNDSHALARYSLFLSALDRSDEAFDMASLAQRLDPLSITVRFAPGMARFYARRYDEAIAEFQHLKDLPPYSLRPNDRVGLARSLAARGQLGAAIREMTAAIQQGGALLAWQVELARMQVRAGHREDAQRLLQRLEAMPEQGPTAAQIAFLHIALGNTDRAFAALQRAADLRSPALLWINVDPRFDPLRSDPRFRELPMRVGLPQ